MVSRTPTLAPLDGDEREDRQMPVRMRPQDERGVSLIELVAALLVMSILAGISVPLAAADGRFSVLLTARHIAVVLRLAQTTAQAEGDPVRFEILGSKWRVRSGQGSSAVTIVSGDLGAVSCTTNYPGGWVEFDRRGYPLSLNAAPRAGSFTFSYGGLQSGVVLQLTGRVRVK
jgi:prepilin-type N-terminal cleavage/methylation domain-containing protein